MAAQNSLTLNQCICGRHNYILVRCVSYIILIETNGLRALHVYGSSTWGQENGLQLRGAARLNLEWDIRDMSAQGAKHRKDVDDANRILHSIVKSTTRKFVCPIIYPHLDVQLADWRR
ncbi:hypothetical protein FRC12_001704 [Ceratobasidium sp. 428]|nr:hypothetical protein FRC12_001704 [Ceratobasidium sp. 428]